MANAALNWAFRYSKAEHGSRLVIITLADQLNFHEETKDFHSGWYCFPSIEFIAEYARICEAAVYNALNSLVEIGEVIVDHRPGKRSVFRMPLFETWYKQTAPRKEQTLVNNRPLQNIDPSKNKSRPLQNLERPLQNLEKKACVSLTNPELPLNRPLSIPLRTPQRGNSRSAASSEHNQKQKAKRLDREASVKRELQIGRAPELMPFQKLSPAGQLHRAEMRARSILRSEHYMTVAQVKAWLAEEYGELAEKIDIARVMPRQAKQ